jgi:hypothetical protein
MQKYNELKEERDLLKTNLNKNMNSDTNNYALNAIEEKKKELLLLSRSVQEKIEKYEAMQGNTE